MANRKKSDYHESGQLPVATLKKHVGAIHTSGELSLIERKTGNVLLLNAYQNLLTQRTHQITVPLLCAMLGFESNNIEYLKNVLKKLASTSIEFNVMQDGRESWKVMSMLSFGDIEDGVCAYRYDEYLAERLYDPEIYATINMVVQRDFDSGYALTLYENCLRYRSIGSTGWWTIERFRTIMGASAQLYDEFKYLKRDIIIKPVIQVNRISDIHIEPEYQKNGCKVMMVRFLVQDSKQQTLLTMENIDQFAAIREHPTYRKLIEHGIGERLAILWVTENEQHARAVIDYVELKDKKKQVKGSTAGYIRKLIEDNAEVGKSAYVAVKEAAARTEEDDRREKACQEKLAGLRKEFNTSRIIRRIGELSLEERCRLAEDYIRENGAVKARSYDPATAVFKDAIERIQFDRELRRRLAVPMDKMEFAGWLRNEKGLDPKTLESAADKR